MNSPRQRHHEIDRLAQEFVERKRRGEAPTIHEYTTRYPALASDIRSVFPLLSALESIAPESPRIGTHIGPYKIVREVGRGGMGIVYEAIQAELGRRVALKVLPVQATQDSQFLERFRREAQAAAKLEHASIVPVIGAGSDGEIHYYSMQFIEGRGLDCFVQEQREKQASGLDARTKRDYRAVAEIGRNVAEAIAHAHAQGILHRDIKPTNVLLDRADHAWVTDFGLCQPTDAQGLTRTGDVIGTFRYMPPERFSGVSDVRGDVYGIGITLFELLTLRRAYEGDDAATLATRIVREGAPKPSRFDTRIPRELDLIVRKATAHDPNARYGTAEALASDLRAYLSDRPIAARAPTTGYLLRKTVSRHKALAAAIGVSALLLIGSGLWYVRDLRVKEHVARQRQYLASIHAVAAARQGHERRTADVLLDEAPHEFRNWEWSYLKAQLHNELRSFENHDGSVQAIAFSPDRRRFGCITGRHVQIVDYASGSRIARMALSGWGMHIAWSADGARVAAATTQGIEIWDVLTSKRLIEKSAKASGWVSFRNGSKEVVAGMQSGAIVRLDASTGDELSRIEHGEELAGVDSSHTHEFDLIATVTSDSQLSVHDLSTGTSLWSVQLAPKRARHVIFANASTIVTSARLMDAWDAKTGEHLWTAPIGDGAYRPIRDPSGVRVLVHVGDQLRVLDAAQGDVLHAIKGRTSPRRGAIHPNGRTIVVGSISGELQEWYLGDGRDPHVLGRHMDDILAMDVHPSGHTVVSCGFGGIVRVWDLSAGQLARAQIAHKATALSIRYSDDGRWLASTDLGGEIHLWNGTTAEPVHHWSVGARTVSSIVFLPMDRGLLSYDTRGTLCLWSIPDGELLARHTNLDDWSDTPNRTPLIDVSHDGAWIAYTLSDGTIAIHEGKHLRRVRKLHAHETMATGVAFHPTKPLLATVANEGVLRLWNPRKGSPTGEYKPASLNIAPETGINRVAFSPDGTRMATGAFDGTLTIWDTSRVRPLVNIPWPYWISSVRFGPGGARIFAGMAYGSIGVADTVPMKQRAPAFERAAKLREDASAVCKDLLERHDTYDAALVTLESDEGMDSSLQEACRRQLHAERASIPILIKRLWRDLTDPNRSSDDYELARGIAEGLWRTSRHWARPNAESDSLLALAFLRCDQPKRALRVAKRVASLNKKRAPEMYAVDLCVSILAYRKLNSTNGGAITKTRLEALLHEQPLLRTPRVISLEREANAD